MFEVIDFSKKEKWNDILKDKIEVYYKWQYISAFKTCGDGYPYLAYLKKGDTIIYNTFFKRNILDMNEFLNKINKPEMFDIVTPYGYGGIDIIGEYDESLLEQFHFYFNEYCEKNNIVSEFIRMSPLRNNYRFYENTNYEVLNISNTIHMKLENEKQIWDDMESRSRNVIRKALKNNVEIKKGFNIEMLEEFKTIYYSTMEKDNAEAYYFFDNEFFNDFYNNMENNAFIITAYLDKTPISSSLIMYSSDNGHYHLSGTLKEYLSYGANNLILYESALELLNKNCKRFHLGGGYGGDSSPLLKFKKSLNKFGKSEFYIGRKIYNQLIYDELVDLRKKEKDFNKDSGFFPLYRS